MKDQDHQKLKEAIRNDGIRKELFKSLFDLYATAMPNVVVTSSKQIQCHYSEEVEQMAEKIREQIRCRDNQLYSFHTYS